MKILIKESLIIIRKIISNLGIIYIRIQNLIIKIKKEIIKKINKCHFKKYNLQISININ